MASPLISIVTAVKDQEKFLSECFASIASQKNLNFEHIIVDGFSSDKSYSLAQEYKAENELRYPITLFQSKPKGISDAMNQGILHAKGEYVIIIHGDDFLHDPKSTERMEKAIKETKNAPWIIANSTREVFWGRHYVPTYQLRHAFNIILPVLNRVGHQNMLIKREIAPEIDLYHTNLKYLMDHNKYLELLDNHISPVYVNTTFAVFRKHRNSASTNIKNFPAMTAELMAMHTKRTTSKVKHKILGHH